jgi:hypothetical protein
MKHKAEDGRETLVPYLVSKKAERGLTGKHVTVARVVSNPLTGEPEIDFELDKEGAEKFAQITKEFSPSGNRTYQLAIVLDGELYSAPTIHGEIPGGRAQITGNFDIKEAFELANVLQNPLEVPGQIITEQSVDPSLGKDSIRSGITAAIVGTLAVSPNGEWLAAGGDRSVQRSGRQCLGWGFAVLDGAPGRAGRAPHRQGGRLPRGRGRPQGPPHRDHAEDPRMTATMTGLVQYALQPQAVELRELPVPELGDEDVLLRVGAVSVCGSDVHQYHNKQSWAVNVPVVLGHEFGGQVARLGTRVCPWRARVPTRIGAAVDGRARTAAGGHAQADDDDQDR